MRLLVLVSFVILASSLSFVSLAQDPGAQDKAVGDKPAESQASDNGPIEDTAKPSGEDRSEKVEAEDDSFDMDSFFKQGEENAKNGSSCSSPSEPIS